MIPVGENNEIVIICPEESALGDEFSRNWSLGRVMVGENENGITFYLPPIILMRFSGYRVH